MRDIVFAMRGVPFVAPRELAVVIALRGSLPFGFCRQADALSCFFA
jgi:hypothetical protein